MSKRVLGRGLDALISSGDRQPTSTRLPSAGPPSPAGERASSTLTDTGETRGDRVLMVAASDITPNPRQPRREFDEARLEELARSVQECGILEPLILSPLEGGRYELIAGERRLRAALRAGLTTVPAILRQVNSHESLELALIENVQREDLNPVDEARAYLQLSEEFGRTHNEISEKVGQDRSTITNLLRMLRLPDEVLQWVSRGTLGVGHARVLLTIADREEQIRLAELMASENWSVRAAERWVAKRARSDSLSGGAKRKPEPNREVSRVEEALRYALGTEVRLIHSANGGRIEIRYGSEDELERLLGRLGAEVH